MTGVEVSQVGPYPSLVQKGPTKGAPEIPLALPALMLATLASCDEKV